jgi:hypothetical protein
VRGKPADQDRRAVVHDWHGAALLPRCGVYRPHVMLSA